MTSINKLIEAHERLTTVLKPKTSASKDPSGAIQEVKELYMHHKHQDCSKRAIVYISELGHNAHPLHRAALYFYAGLSYDTLARNTPYRSAVIFGNLDQAQMYYQLAIEALEYPEQQSDGEGANNSPSKSHHTLFLVSSSIPRASRSAASLRDLTVIDEEKKTPCFSTPPRKALRCTILSTSPASPSLYSNDGNDTEQIWSPEVKIGTPRHPLSKLTYLSPIPTSLRTATDTSVTANALKSSVSSQHSATARTRIGNFNAALDVFADMLAEHSASAARFKQKVLKKQSEEHSPASFPASRQLGGDRRGSGHRSVGEPGGDVGVPGSPGGSRMSWEEMVLRIDQLRARNWEMPGFDAEYYRGLCERAMEDLGG